MSCAAWFETLPMGLSSRSITADDMAFLLRVYASTREAELALTDWTAAQKEAFVRMQFQAQHQHYATHYPGAAFRVIEEVGTPIGRIYVDEGSEELRVIDISLLPEHRGRGIGTAVLRCVLAHAAGHGKRVGLHVETFNPALRLYRRLGFDVSHHQGLYCFMEWSDRVSA